MVSALSNNHDHHAYYLVFLCWESYPPNKEISSGMVLKSCCFSWMLKFYMVVLRELLFNDKDFLTFKISVISSRTSLFMKENKYFSQLNFWLPLGYVFALGLFFTEDTSQTRLLHRDMTDEWKGNHQENLLIY